MAKKRLESVALPARERRAPEALGPGLHGAVIELKSQHTFQLRTTDGRRVTASLGDGVAPALADECLRTGALVIVVDTPRGPAIAGALQTSLPLACDARGVLNMDAREIRMRADRGLSMEVGPLTITAEPSGALRIDGDRLVIDMAALVRIFSSRVDLP